MTTLASTAPVERRRYGFDMSKPVLLAFAVILCVLIVLPLAWLAVYAFTDKTGAFTVANFHRLVVDDAYLDPLITTFTLATLSALIGSRADGVAGGAHRHAAAPHRADPGDGVLRDAAVSRRHRLGTVGGAQ